MSSSELNDKGVFYKRLGGTLEMEGADKTMSVSSALQSTVNNGTRKHLVVLAVLGGLEAAQ